MHCECEFVVVLSFEFYYVAMIDTTKKADFLFLYF